MRIYLQGLTMGLAYVAPIGLQNLFVINSALTQRRSRVYLTALIVILWDVSLGVSCFLGAGALMQALPWLQKVILGIGSLIVIWIGIGLLRSTASLEGGRDVNVPIWKLISSAFVVTWINPQALIDGTMMLGAFRALVWSTVLSAPFAIFVFAGHSVASLLVGIALWGVGMGAQESILKAAVSSMVSKVSRATGYGVFECAFGVFWFLGSWLLGVLYDVSIPAMIAVSVAAQLAAIPLYIASSRRQLTANP